MATVSLEGLRTLLEQSLELPKGLWDQITELADQLDGRPVLPVIGAGASASCGVPTAAGLGDRLRKAIDDDDIRIDNPPEDLASCDLSRLADAVCLTSGNGPGTVFDALGFRDTDEWPGTGGVADHGCAYRILARFARERLIRESITFNYDSHHEYGCEEEGFLARIPAAPETVGRLWPQRYDVVSDAASNSRLLPRGDFVVVKAHGSIDRWRELEAKGEKDRADAALIIRWSDLLDWRQDYWSRDLIADRARRHILLVLGFSGQDAVIHVSLTRVMEEVRKSRPAGPARIRVLDYKPEQLTLQMLVGAGKGEGPPSDETVAIRAEHNGEPRLGAVLLGLLIELLAIRLRAAGISIASDRRTRVLQIGVYGPAMARWSWRLRLPLYPRELDLGVDLMEGKDRCYVPLLADPSITRRAFEARSRVIKACGLPAEDQLPSGSLDGFLMDRVRGRAIMPLGLELPELENALHSIQQVDAELSGPNVERFVAGLDDHSQPVLFSMKTGKREELGCPT